MQLWLTKKRKSNRGVWGPENGNGNGNANAMADNQNERKNEAPMRDFLCNFQSSGCHKKKVSTSGYTFPGKGKHKLQLILCPFPLSGLSSVYCRVILCHRLSLGCTLLQPSIQFEVQFWFLARRNGILRWVRGGGGGGFCRFFDRPVWSIVSVLALCAGFK